MKNYLLFAFLFLNFQAFSQNSQHQFDANIEIPVDLGYLLHTPPGYENSGNKYPLIVFLHGAGERGTDISRVSIHGPLKYIREGNTLEAVILAPQNPKGNYWDPHQVAALVKKIINEEKIDPNRVYLTGLSMGGYGTWATGGEYPELFAAMAPICGIIYPPLYRNIQHVKEMPIWVFHGALDQVVAPSNSNKMVQALKNIGNNVKYTVYPFANHDSWTKTYNNPEFYTWLFNQEKNRNELKN